MRKYAKIINSKNNKVAYCRLFQQSEVDFDPENSYHVIFKDGVDVNLKRDFATWPQIMGGETLPQSLEDAVLWAFEPQEIQERGHWGTVYHNGRGVMIGTNSYLLNDYSYEESVEILNDGGRPIALLVAGATNAHHSSDAYDHAYLMWYSKDTDRYYTSNQTTDRVGLLTELTWYDENPNYQHDPLNRRAFFMGWRMGQRIRGLRSGAAEATYHVTFVNGILYISKAPAKFDGSVLSLMAADAGGE